MQAYKCIFSSSFKTMKYISHNFYWDVKILNENSENGKNNGEVKNGYFSLYKTQCLSPQRAVQ